MEKLWTVSLRELTLIRILCQGRGGNCPGVVELAVDKMVQVYQCQKCPLCGAEIPNTSPNYLQTLGQAIIALSAMNSLRVEFVVRQDG